MTDEEFKQLRRRLRFSCRPGAEEIRNASYFFFDWGALAIALCFLVGIILISVTEDDGWLYIAGIISIFFAVFLFIVIPFISTCWTKRVSRRVHRKYMCQCPWHIEKFGKE